MGALHAGSIEAAHQHSLPPPHLTQHTMEIFGLWLIGSFVVAIIANSRGRSGFGWFMLSALFSPLLMGILVLALGDTDEKKAAAAPAPEPQWLATRDASFKPAVPETTTTSAPTSSVADELRKLADLRDTGILTAEEFEAQKRRLLNA